jgi:two-component SAPR family response regulator
MDAATPDKNLVKLFILSSFLFIIPYSFCAIKGYEMERGLYFYSHAIDKDKRTGLDLTPEKPFSSSQKFTISFDFKIRAGEDNYGYVFRLIGNDTVNIDFISDIAYSNLYMVVKDKTLLRFNTDKIPDFGFDQWMNVKLTVDLKENKLHFSINGENKSIESSLLKLKKFRIFFGGNKYKEFATTDVPPMVLKNLCLFNDKNQLIRNWKMEKHGDNCVFDECKSAVAVVVNPLWEIDKHVYWKTLKTIRLSSLRHPQIAFDSKNKRIFIVERNWVYTYDLKSNSTDSTEAEFGLPYYLKINQLHYDIKRDRLFLYEFEKNRLNQFDFQTKKWDENNNSLFSPNFMHHNRYYDENEQMIYTFGGYGFHFYSSLLQTFSENEQNWRKIDLSNHISPRYLAGMGVWNDSLFLCFGGYGNDSGKQYEFPHNYYDLYSINPKTAEVKKLWDLESVEKNFTNSNSLIVNNENQTFYTLTYPNHVYETQLSLHEYRLDAPLFRLLGNAIPFRFNDVDSYCDLFKPDDNSALYAITSFMEETIGNEINIYSITYPPLSISDTLQSGKKNNASLFRIVLLIVGGIVLVGASALYVSKLIKQKKQLPFFQNTMDILMKRSKSLENKINTDNPIFPAIHLLGGFQVIDNHNTNITNNFTPTSKQLFFLLYFRTVNDHKGISSLELSRMLWPDVDEKNVRNSRKNVYLSKLRSLLNDVGDIKITYENAATWTISLNDSLFIDYEQVVRLISHFGKNVEIDKNELRKLLNIAKQGKLLPYYEFEWLDDYKANYEALIINHLLKIASDPQIKTDLPLLLAISDVILIQDSIEEAGIKLKCNTLLRLGKKKPALQCYNKYVEEHLRLLGIKPELAFETILSNYTQK